ncbi:hypothetical protein [Luteimonas sp. A611]
MDFDPRVDRVVQLLAGAFGYGAVLVTGGYTMGKERPWNPTHPETGDGDDSNPAANPGLLICRPSEVLETAGKAISPKSPEYARWLAKLKPADREAVVTWNAQTDIRIRGRGQPYRFGEFQHWKRTQGVMVFPRTKPRHCVLLAMTVASLDGPLSPWLHMVAAGQHEQWAKVRPYAVACGHPGWAADEAAYRLCVRREPIRERAKARGVRAATYAPAVDRAETRLREWLERACLRVLAVYESGSESFNFGDPSALRAETWWHPERNPAQSAGNPKRRREGVRSRQSPPGFRASRAAPRRRAASIHLDHSPTG